MNPTQRAKIRGFLKDKELVSCVKGVLQSFIKKTPAVEVHILAASFLSLKTLDEGFSELERIGTEEEDKTERTVNQGL